MDLTPELLVTARIALGMTREELAEESGVGLRTLQDFETFRRSSGDTYRRLKRALEDRGVRFVQAGEGHGPGFLMPESWVSAGPDFIAERQPRRDLRKTR